MISLCPHFWDTHLLIVIFLNYGYASHASGKCLQNFPCCLLPSSRAHLARCPLALTELQDSRPCCEYLTSSSSHQSSELLCLLSSRFSFGLLWLADPHSYQLNGDLTGHLCSSPSPLSHSWFRLMVDLIQDLLDIYVFAHSLPGIIYSRMAYII